MKKQDYLLFAIIIIAFIIWMYIVQKYFTVSYDELTIEEKIRYEQFMLPWKESERMTHIETLVMNEVRKALENLQNQGVGYIDFEQSGIIHYSVDGICIRVEVADVTSLSKENEHDGEID